MTKGRGILSNEVVISQLRGVTLAPHYRREALQRQRRRRDCGYAQDVPRREYRGPTPIAPNVRNQERATLKMCYASRFIRPMTPSGADFMYW